MSKEIGRGAEAVVFEENNQVKKERLPKKYRHPQLDLDLRKNRTKTEAKILSKLKAAHPRLISTDNFHEIVMEKVEGEKIKDILNSKPGLAEKIGNVVAEMHNENIIHGDLTTSNMILSTKGKIVLIDFGLSFQSHKIEDKAVDIHLFKQALESTHVKAHQQALKKFLKGYSCASQYKEIIKRLEEVERRGRYRKG
jgi:Kae1-associated kinase Bud32